MADNKFRNFRTFYGIDTENWVKTYPGFSSNQKWLVEEYISEGCSCVTSSKATDTNEFLYANYIAEKYFIEGVIKGEVSFAASGATSHITSYRVTVCSVHENTTTAELFSTGWVTVDDDLDWDATYSIGDEIVYHWEIDAHNKATLSENERIYIKIETDSDYNCVLWHDNDSTLTDVWFEIPFRY